MRPTDGDKKSRKEKMDVNNERRLEKRDVGGRTFAEKKFSRPTFFVEFSFRGGRAGKEVERRNRNDMREGECVPFNM